MTRAAILALLLSACADPPAHVGTATVYTYPTGAVVFHGSDGRMLATVLADARGKADGPMEPGGMVTYHLPTLTELYETRGDVQPGDTIVSPDLDDPPQQATPTSVLMVEMPPITDPSANTVVLDVACGDSFLAFDVSRTRASFTVDVPTSCLVAVRRSCMRRS